MNDILEEVRRDGLLAPGRPVIVLVSGGRDSTCLLDVAVRVSGPEAVRALHVNYGLREAADGDEAHCRELCVRLGIPLEIHRPSQRAPGNLQAWAREERYRVSAALAEPMGADVAAGHTATDQVETILYRLASSPSRRALLGMAPRERTLIRPLLAFTREETAGYCRGRGLSWREDESNQSHAYARARVRHRLVPGLRAVHPAAEENVLALSAILRDEAEVLNALVDEALPDRDHIELSALRDLPVALCRLVVQGLADQALGGPAPGAGRRAHEVAALSPNAVLDLPHGVRAVVEDGILRMERTPKLSSARAAKKQARGRLRPARPS